MRSRNTLSRVGRTALAGVAVASMTFLIPGGKAAGRQVREADPYGVTVSDSGSIDGNASEVQSTVVPPNTNRMCPQGRLLISNDAVTTPAEVALLDLDTLGPSPTYSTFDGPNDLGTTRDLKSSDHDLIALPDGVVLLLKMGRTKAMLNPKPAWFDLTYKISKDGDLVFGPGARSEIFVWRSIDCGQTFTFVSGIDTAALDDGYGTSTDGSGGLPQWADRVWPYWQMGGTDGPLARVDPATGRVFVTMGLVGFKPESTMPFWLSDKPLNRTIVMMSSDKGSTWERASLKYFNGWRVDVVPRPNDNLAVAHVGKSASESWTFVDPFNQIGFIPLVGTPALSYVAPTQQPPGGWDQSYCSHKLLYTGSCDVDGKSIGINLMDRAILTRSPGSKNLLLSYTDTLDFGKGDGFRMFLHQGGTSTWLHLPPIAPKVADADNYLIHVTPIDVGRGPVFFYWYDVNTATSEVAIRGRLQVEDDKTTASFGVSRTGGAPVSFSVAGMKRSYGDYHTAGGYYRADSSQPWAQTTYHYYPVWVEPDGKIHFAHVQFMRPIVVSPIDDDQVPDVLTDRKQKIVSKVRIDVSTLEYEREEETRIRR